MEADDRIAAKFCTCNGGNTDIAIIEWAVGVYAMPSEAPILVHAAHLLFESVASFRSSTAELEIAAYVLLFGAQRRSTIRRP